jgi:SAM-dependent methyltransferase
VSPLLKQGLLALATEPYRQTGNLNFRWARGKLRHDPAFTFLLEQRILPDGAHVLDLGCGRGLLAAWFLAAERLAAEGRWSGAVAPPVGLRFRGIELLEREAECGNRALQPVYGDRLELTAGDLRDANLRSPDVVVMLDVLHYIPYADQERLLDRIRAALHSGSLVVTRVGDAGAGLRFRFGQMVDRLVILAGGRRLPRMWCRPTAGWISALESRGFAVSARPMSAGTPFANVLLISRVR